MLQSLWRHNVVWEDVSVQIRIFMLLLNFNGQATGYILTTLSSWDSSHGAFAQSLRDVPLWQCSCSGSVNRHKVMRTTWGPSVSVTPQSYRDPPLRCRSHLYRHVSLWRSYDISRCVHTARARVACRDCCCLLVKSIEISALNSYITEWIFTRLLQAIFVWWISEIILSDGTWGSVVVKALRY
jgi:hypothetical protein